MRTFVILFFCTVVLSGCGTPGHLDLTEREMVQQASLYKIFIERWQKPVFSGLVAIEYRGDGMRYVLLDASGIRLFSADIYSDKEFMLINSVAAVGDTKLPEYLSLWLKRTLLMEPAEQPCSWMGLNSFCVKDNKKTARTGPFLHWTVRETVARKNRVSYRYEQPVIGVALELHPMN